MNWRKRRHPWPELPGNIHAPRAKFYQVTTVRSFVPFLILAEVVFSFEMEPFTVVLHEIGGVEIVPEGDLLFVGLEFRYCDVAHLLTLLYPRLSPSVISRAVIGL